MGRRGTRGLLEPDRRLATPHYGVAKASTLPSPEGEGTFNLGALSGFGVGPTGRRNVGCKDLLLGEDPPQDRHR